MPEIADGKYRGKALAWGLGEAGTGREQVAVQFQVLDREGVAGPTLTWYGYFTDKALEITIRALRACGWEGTDLSDLQGLDKNEVQLVIENEQDEQGSTYPRIQFVNSLGGLALKTPMSAERAKAFAAEMKGRIIAVGQGQPSRQKRATAGRPGPIGPEPPPFTDDDIPF